MKVCAVGGKEDGHVALGKRREEFFAGKTRQCRFHGIHPRCLSLPRPMAQAHKYLRFAGASNRVGPAHAVVADEQREAVFLARPVLVQNEREADAVLGILVLLDRLRGKLRHRVAVRPQGANERFSPGVVRIVEHVETGMRGRVGREHHGDGIVHQALRIHRREIAVPGLLAAADDQREKGRGGGEENYLHHFLPAFGLRVMVTRS